MNRVVPINSVKTLIKEGSWNGKRVRVMVDYDERDGKYYYIALLGFGDKEVSVGFKSIVYPHVGGYIDWSLLFDLLEMLIVRYAWNNLLKECGLLFSFRKRMVVAQMIFDSLEETVEIGLLDNDR